MSTQVPWAGACVFCRRGIQREADGLFWADADGSLACAHSTAPEGIHEPEVPPALAQASDDYVATEQAPRRRVSSAGWVIPDGWTFTNLGECRSCRTPVAWCITPGGSKAPVDRDGKSHFATCPQASTWRRR